MAVNVPREGGVGTYALPLFVATMTTAAGVYRVLTRSSLDRRSPPLTGPLSWCRRLHRQGRQVAFVGCRIADQGAATVAAIERDIAEGALRAAAALACQLAVDLGHPPAGGLAAAALIGSVAFALQLPAGGRRGLGLN